MPVIVIPLIQQEFSLRTDTIQWLQTLYVLTYGGFLILGGKLSDQIGRKSIFITGCALFLLTSLGAGFAPSFEWIVALRALQGIAAALMMPSALAIITNTFTERQERSKAIGIFSSFAAIGSGSGLSLGGLIATWWGWQWIFFINIPIIALTIILAILFIKNDTLTPTESSLDFISVLLLISTIVLLTYFIHNLGYWEEEYKLLIGLIIGILTGGWGFIHRIRRQKQPLIDFSMLNRGITITGNGVFLLLGAFFTGYLFTLSITLQQNMQYSAAKAGLILFPFSILSAIVSKSVIPRLFRTLNVLQMGVLGMSLMFAGATILLLSILVHYPFLLILISVACVTGSGMAICFTSLTLMSVQEVSESHHGLASSIATTCYFFGAGIGLSILSLFFQMNTTSDSVTIAPLMVLCCFAFLGIATLVIYKNAYALKRKKIPKLN